MKLIALSFSVCTVLGAPLFAEPYRLIAGDRVTLSYNLLTDAKVAMVDIDGNIRLAELGSIVAVGKTLDGLQADVATAMIENGFSGSPFVTAEILEYAPIMVLGFVERSGVYPYVPGMTAGVAMALSGDAGAKNASFANVEIAALNARHRAESVGAQIASTVAQIARLQAGLSGTAAPISVSDDLRTATPAQELPHLEVLLATEAELLLKERGATQELLTSWEKEVADNLIQIQLLDTRIGLKAETVAQLALDVDSARSLQSQGLSTNVQTTNSIQRLSDEREELLALETAKLNVERSRALAQRNRQQYEADSIRNDMQELAQAKARLNLLVGDRRLALDELSLLQAEIGVPSITDGSISLQLELQGPRADRIDPKEVNENSPLLPGDIIVVKALRKAD
jgi:protein involved in polysaccharide export with SLBB domain